MNLKETAAEEAFRAEVRSFIEEKLPEEISSAPTVGVTIEKPLLKKWHKALYEKGWVAPAWPEEYGGTGWSATERHIFQEEAAKANAPRLMAFGLSMVGPVIYTFGNEEQKKRHLPGILSGDVWWCQGYSEPGSGSDLASLKTKAVREGEHYIVNGQKIWTSYAHEADWIFCLVRTDETGKKQEGISFLLIDMNSPGIEIRPIYTIDGMHHLNEVFFTDVKVPAENLIGEENKGWTYAKFLLANERTGIAGVPESKRRVALLKRMAAQEKDGDGGTLSDDEGFMRRLANLEVKLTSLDYLNLRKLAEAAAGKQLGPETSALKVIGSEVAQELQTLAVEAIAFYVQPFHRDQLMGLVSQNAVGPDYASTVFSNYAFGRASTIYGGSNEIQRDVLAKGVLGL